MTYCRISNDKRKNEAGVERQRADTDRLAKRLGYRVTERIVDNDRSASRKKRRRREGFDRMLELVQAGDVDAVVVYDLDRFTRNPDELGAWIDAAEANEGVSIHTTGDLIDLADPDSIFKARILLAVAEKEAANIARRVKREAASAAEQGLPRWGQRPFGFNRDGTHVPAEVAELRAIYADVIAGRSMASIAKSLNDRGIPNAGKVRPKREAPDANTGDNEPASARWQSATVGFLVRAARNAGLREYRGEMVGPGTWAPIVDEETWRQAVAALDARKAGVRKAPRSLLGGIVRCAECGGVMSRSARAYRCLPRSDGYKTTCGLSIAGDRLDEYVTGLVLAALGDVAPTHRQANGANLNRASADVTRLRDDLDELAAMFGRGELTISAFKKAKQPLDVRLARAEAALTHEDASAALARMAGPVATLAERWGDLDVQLRARIIGTVIDRVVVRRAERAGAPFSAARVDPILRD